MWGQHCVTHRRAFSVACARCDTEDSAHSKGRQRGNCDGADDVLCYLEIVVGADDHCSEVAPIKTHLGTCIPLFEDRPQLCIGGCSPPGIMYECLQRYRKTLEGSGGEASKGSIHLRGVLRFSEGEKYEGRHRPQLAAWH